MKKDVVIIGGGASGLMCAMEAGKRGRSVVVLEHSEKLGKKVRISGGGRCNFTNLGVHPDHYLSRNPRFCRSALARFTPQDFISLLEKHRVRYYEKEEGRLFCQKTAASVTQMLERECAEAGVEIWLNCRISGIEKKEGFVVMTKGGTLKTESLVIATGGLSYRELGSSDLGYRIARQFDIGVTPLGPGLVPLTLSATDATAFSELSGISLDASVSYGGRDFLGGVLFTHRGLSGPAILQISLYWKNGDAITVNLLPHFDAYEVLRAKRQSRMQLHNLLAGHLPQRLASKWCEIHGPSIPMNHYTEKELKRIAYQLSHWEVMPCGTEGYGKAEVTVGGVDTEELSSKTMEVKKIPGLYFIGEVVDVTGQLGGYNLQWAWASGFVAGQYA